MTSRQLVTQAIGHQQPRRIPWTLYLAGPVRRALEELWGPGANGPVRRMT